MSYDKIYKTKYLTLYILYGVICASSASFPPGHIPNGRAAGGKKSIGARSVPNKKSVKIRQGTSQFQNLRNLIASASTMNEHWQVCLVAPLKYLGYEFHGAI